MIGLFGLFDGKPQLAWGTIATVPTGSATTGTNPVLTAGQGARFPTAIMPYNARVGPADPSTWTTANTEIVRITARPGSADTLTVTRQQEGSSARAMVVGDRIEVVDTDKAINDWELAMANASPAFPSAQFYGHSFFAGAGAAAPKYGMIQRTARELGISFDGQALNGGQVCAPASLGGPATIMQNPDFATDLVRGKYQTPGGLKSACIGFNDYTGFQALTNGNAQVENALTFVYSRMLAARVMLPLKRGAAGIGVALESGGDVTFVGTWSGTAANADTTLSEGLGYAATVTVNDSGDFALDSLYNGEALCAFFPIIGNVCRFTAEVRLDPAGANTLLGTKDFTQWQANLVSAGLGASGSIQCIRIPAGTVSPGAHVIRVKITAITASNAGTIGGLIIEGAAPLIVPTASVFPISVSLTAQGAWDAARSLAAAAVFPTAVPVSLTPALAPNAAAYTTNDGSDAVALADANTYWSTTQNGHPNALGYARCAQLLLEAAKDATLPKLAEMNSYQPSPRALAKWMKPNQGWVSNVNKGVAENFPRELVGTGLTLVTAKVYALGDFTIPAGKIAAGLELYASTAGTLTGRWVALARKSDLMVIAVSANATTAFSIVAGTPQWFLKPYMATDDLDVYAILGVVFSVAPVLRSRAVDGTQQARAPVMNGISTTVASATPPTAEVPAASGLTPVTGTTLGALTTALASVPHATLLG